MPVIFADAVKAVPLFAITNLDDLIVLTALLSASNNFHDRRRVVFGQFAGFTCILGITALAALGLFEVPARWTAILGLVPLGVGTKGLLELRTLRARGPRKSLDDKSLKPTPQIPGLGMCTLITLANGGDNVAVYAPFVRIERPINTGVILVTFLLLLPLWCMLARALSRNPMILRVLNRVDRALIPLVLIVIGAIIIFRLEPGL